MTGVIWFVQIVHYPLFNRVGENDFVRFESAHAALTTMVVFPAMLLELVSAAALLLHHFEESVAWRYWLGLGLLAVIWFSTMFIQVPKHSELSAGFNAAVHASLVATNWIRTVAWSLRSLLALWLISDEMK